jgi:ribosomal protein S18 acetylase RimI-like enzyme
VKVVQDPDELAALFASDPETHIYGLADLEEPFWSNSKWYRDGPAVVGLVSTGGSWLTVYAMSRQAPQETLGLLTDLMTSIPAGTWITGPTGMYRTVSTLRKAKDIGSHWRMVLGELGDGEESSAAVPLGPDDLEAVVHLHSSDEGSAFFLPVMLDLNPFMGIWEDGQLMASAGTHVVSRRYGVAAIGAVITRPSHRGRGLGALVLSALCRRLADEYETIGLNVETSNESALRLYDRLGFRRVLQYEEIEVL